jgi:hypothetical protein
MPPEIDHFEPDNGFGIAPSGKVEKSIRTDFKPDSEGEMVLAGFPTVGVREETAAVEVGAFGVAITGVLVAATGGTPQAANRPPKPNSPAAFRNALRLKYSSVSIISEDGGSGSGFFAGIRPTPS